MTGAPGDDHAVRRLCRQLRHRAHAALDVRGGGVELQRQFRDETAGVVSMPLFIRTAEVFLHSRKPVRTLADLQGLKIRTAGRLARHGQDDGRGARDNGRRRDLYRARARHDRRDRMGHVVGEHLARLLQGREVPHHPRRPPADRAFRAGHQPGRLGQVQRPRQEAGRARGQAGDVRVLDRASARRTPSRWTSTAGRATRSSSSSPRSSTRCARLANKWADEQAAKDAWFKKVLDSQREFEKLWKDADNYRKVKIAR